MREKYKYDGPLCPSLVFRETLVKNRWIKVPVGECILTDGHDGPCSMNTYGFPPHIHQTIAINSKN